MGRRKFGMSSESPANIGNAPEGSLEKAPGIPLWLTVLSAVFFVGGAGVFAGSVGGALAHRAWQVYLINFVFFAGLSFGAGLFVSVLNMTNAVWGRSLKRLAESLGAFVPVSFI